ncbi:hypothetical protein [Actinophytocola sediminis]
MTTSSARRWPRWPWLVLTLVGVAIAVTATIVGDLVEPEAAATGTPATVTVTVTEVQPSMVTRTVAPTSPAGPAARFDDGLVVVGVDVPAGTFRTDGPDGTNPSGCYWSRINPSGDVIANGVLRRSGAVTMSDGDRFDTAGCLPWQRAT